jgi:hypothetical protein
MVVYVELCRGQSIKSPLCCFVITAEEAFSLFHDVLVESFGLIVETEVVVCAGEVL